mmetsp:Transcript_5839/g.13921  ORF Transcript_5839/g.13921 Transcript_5839/m.13921 type:complete len:231 (+) Transcript_5839:599-1291(+)
MASSLPNLETNGIADAAHLRTSAFAWPINSRRASNTNWLPLSASPANAWTAARRTSSLLCCRRSSTALRQASFPQPQMRAKARAPVLRTSAELSSSKEQRTSKGGAVPFGHTLDKASMAVSLVFLSSLLSFGIRSLMAIRFPGLTARGRTFKAATQLSLDLHSKCAHKTLSTSSLFKPTAAMIAAAARWPETPCRKRAVNNTSKLSSPLAVNRASTFAATRDWASDSPSK